MLNRLDHIVLKIKMGKNLNLLILDKLFVILAMSPAKIALTVLLINV